MSVRAAAAAAAAAALAVLALAAPARADEEVAPHEACDRSFAREAGAPRAAPAAPSAPASVATASALRPFGPPDAGPASPAGVGGPLGAVPAAHRSDGPGEAPGEEEPDDAGGEAARALVVAAVRATLPPAETLRIVVESMRPSGLFTRARTLDVDIRRDPDGAVAFRARVVDPPELRGTALLYERTAVGEVSAWSYDRDERRVRRTSDPRRAAALLGTGLSPDDLLGGFLVRCIAPDAETRAFRAAGSMMLGDRRCLLVDVEEPGGDVTRVAFATPRGTPERVQRTGADGAVRMTDFDRWTRLSGWWRPLSTTVWLDGPRSDRSRIVAIRVVDGGPRRSLDPDVFSPRSLGRYP